MTAESEPEETESDAEREEEEQTVKKKISSSRFNTKQDPSQKKLLIIQISELSAT